MDCLFCRIIQEKVPARIIYEDDAVLAFHDLSPKAPQHALIVPLKHIATLNDLCEEDISIAGRILFAAKEVAARLGIAERGYRLVFNCNADAGQAIYHIHCHLLGGRAMRWPPG